MMTADKEFDARGADTARLHGAADAMAVDLAGAARTAWTLAPRSCGIRACAWYHGFYPTLRLLGLAATPDRHAAFFATALGAAARRGQRRVLISGAADSGMLEHVLRAYRDAAQEPRVTVVDLCPTPLALCHHVARKAGLGIATRACDIFDMDAGEGFDLICTHSFLVQFPAAGRRRLMAHWSASLRPGGVVVTNARIAPTRGGPQATRSAPPASCANWSRARAWSWSTSNKPRRRPAAPAHARRCRAPCGTLPMVCSLPGVREAKPAGDSGSGNGGARIPPRSITTGGGSAAARALGQRAAGPGAASRPV